MNKRKINANLIFEKLYEIFSSEFGLYQVMLDLVNSEREAIVSDNIKKLLEITKEQEEVILEVKSLEEKRRRLISDLSHQRQIELSDDQFSLSYIIKLSDELYPSHAMTSKFAEMQKNMKDLLNEIRKVNERNLQIIQKSMKTFDATIELLLSELNSVQVYSKSGRLDKSDSIKEYFLKKLGYVSNSEA